jgi:hypothetical protein
VYHGSWAAKREKCFGWRLHLVWTPAGVPVRFQVLPASFHDLTPVHEVAVILPPGAYLWGDKADHSADDDARLLADTRVRLIPIRRAHMTPLCFLDDIALPRYRHTIDTVNSQVEQMGLERLQARTNVGLELKMQASLSALACTNVN